MLEVLTQTIRTINDSAAFTSIEFKRFFTCHRAREMERKKKNGIFSSFSTAEEKENFSSRASSSNRTKIIVFWRYQVELFQTFPWWEAGFCRASTRSDSFLKRLDSEKFSFLRKSVFIESSTGRSIDNAALCFMSTLIATIKLWVNLQLFAENFVYFCTAGWKFGDLCWFPYVSFSLFLSFTSKFFF